MNYKNYIKSEQWKIKREEALVRAGRKCQLCSSLDRLQVHHNNYERLGAELPTDLIVLCEICHGAFHAKRDARTAEKYQNEEWMKRAKASGPRLPSAPISIPFPPPSVARIQSRGLVEVKITAEYVDSLITVCGGITARGLKLIGETWPPQPGWRRRCIGKTVMIDLELLEDEHKAISEKRNGTYKKWPMNGFEVKLGNVPNDKRQEMIAYFSGGSVSYRDLCRKFNCSRKIVKAIIESQSNDSAIGE